MQVKEENILLLYLSFLGSKGDHGNNLQAGILLLCHHRGRKLEAIMAGIIERFYFQGLTPCPSNSEGG